MILTMKRNGDLFHEQAKILRVKSPIYPLRLGGVWMVGVRGYIGLKKLNKIFPLKYRP